MGERGEEGGEGEWLPAPRIICIERGGKKLSMMYLIL